MDHSHRRHVNAGFVVSIQSVAWTLVSSSLAVLIGIRSGTAVLVAFGAVGAVDAVGSAALAYHFHHGLRHDRLSDELEHLAHRVVLIGLLVVGIAAVVSGAAKAFQATHHDASAAGAVLAAVSLIALSGLALRKQVVARRVGSRALMSDSHLSVTGAALAAITLLGIAASRWFDWQWADGAATAMVGAGAAVLAMVAARDVS